MKVAIENSAWFRYKNNELWESSLSANWVQVHRSHSRQNLFCSFYVPTDTSNENRAFVNVNKNNDWVDLVK